ncbi:hypothetical protein [Mycobacterium sp. M23085]|uniref:hypothetical protein n=1 Tax=Mycobacterium sp. M23085 TaxID=3378087 RepID=UPI003877E5C2
MRILALFFTSGFYGVNKSRTSSNKQRGPEELMDSMTILLAHDRQSNAERIAAHTRDPRHATYKNVAYKAF